MIKRLLLALFTVLLLVVTYNFIPPVYQGDAGSAVYLLNTIATVLSTIFALSLSLIMVAIQLSAGKYSPRIFDFFLRYWLNAPVIIIFVTTILHSTYILSVIKTSNDNTSTILISKAISFDVVMMAYGFIILLIYIFGIVNILKPENLISKLKEEVHEKLTLKRIDEAIIHVERLSDVAKKTAVDMDTVTAVLCIRAIAHSLYDANFDTHKERRWYARHIIANLNAIALVAFNSKISAVAEAIIDEMTQITFKSFQAQDFETAELVVENISVIVSASLVGHNQLMIVRKIVDRMEWVSLKVIPQIDKQEACRFLLKVFKTLNFMGKQIIDAEIVGVTFVAKYMVTSGLGNVLKAVGETNCGKKIPEVFYEYVDLLTMVLRKGETKNIITITTWIREQLLDNHRDEFKTKTFLKVYLIISSVAIYLKSYEKASIIIRAVGKYYAPDIGLLNEIKREELIVRHFFDYNQPEKFLQEAFNIWGIYYGTANMSADVYKKLGKWDSLFDDEIPQEVPEDIITEEDINENK